MQLRAKCALRKFPVCFGSRESIPEPVLQRRISIYTNLSTPTTIMSKLLMLVLVASVLAAVHLNQADALHLCGSKLTGLLRKTCTFSGERWPCFHGERFYKGGYASKGQEIKTSTRIGVAHECCDNSCDITAITKRCCFTIDCLQNCYPESNYQPVDGQVLDGQPVEEAVQYDDEYDDSAEDQSSF